MLPHKRGRGTGASQRCIAAIGALLIAAARYAPAQPGPDAHPAVRSDLIPRTPPTDTGGILTAIAIVLVLIFVNAFLALAEIALITVRKSRIRQLVEEGNASAAKIERMLQHPTRLMATIQTGVTLIATFSSAIAATSMVEPLAHWLRAAGMGRGSAETAALIGVTLPVALLTLVIGEIAPKSLAVRHPERFAMIAVHPIAGLQLLLTPAVAVLTFLATLVVRPFGGTAHFTSPAVNEEELKILVEAGEEQGVLEPEETDMIHSVLDFGDTVVRKVMTPRIDVTACDVDAPMPELILLVHQSGHSRIPVYEGDLDNIVGIVHAKDLLALAGDSSRDVVPIRTVMRAPYFIPETKKVDRLLSEFRHSKQQIAIVRDEYGVTSGLVTIEDLVEQIVGDIQDEYDVEEPMIQVLDRRTTVVDGRVGLGELNDRMELDLPEDEADTIGGFVFGLLGHQAEQDERANWNRVCFVVEATDGRRITKVRVIREEDPPAAKGDGANGNGATDSTNGDGSSRPMESTRIEVSGVETSPGSFFW
ncbi:MAG TPA: hemolysin family protein [Chthonomonadaceae bacterium]|nr:hemolysin family protein [Chthonomonadaceae bacterium]